MNWKNFDRAVWARMKDEARSREFSGDYRIFASDIDPHALEIAKERMSDLPRVTKMRDKLIAELEKIPYSKLNGHRSLRLAGNVNIGFEFIEGESLLLWLDISGICASTGSACSSASLEASHVLLAMGVPHEKAHGSLRLSISHETTEEDIDYIIQTVPAVVERLRNMSPLWEDVVKNNK